MNNDNVLYPEQPILLVDDEPAWLRSLSLALESEAGFDHTLSCHDSREVMGLLAQHEVSVVLLDVNMPHLSGDQLLAQILGEYPDLPVFMISGLNQLERAVECLKLGARDYFVKSTEMERLFAGIRQQLDLRALQRENQKLKQQVLTDRLDCPEVFQDILTRSPKMLALFSYLEAIAESRDPVLITGESGVGKELLAHALHRLSRQRGPWVPANAAGLDDEHFAGTLFGQVPGPQSSIDRRRRGLVERAQRGTLFLDEIGEISADSQRSLLRFAQGGEFTPVGGDIPYRSDARLVCATGHDLQKMVAQGLFRKDLYYRLRVHHLHIPPLRERKEDLQLLLEAFLEEIATTLGKPVPTYPPELLLLLGAYAFPGNVRELRTMVSDAVIQHKSRMLSMAAFKQAMGIAGANDTPASDEPAPVSAEPQVVFPGNLPTLAEVSELLVREALERSGGNQSIAAAMLGITRQALNQRLKKDTPG